MLDSGIATPSPPEHFESLPKCNDAGLHFRIVLGVWMQKCDATHSRRLLRTRSERQRRRAAKRDNKFSPSNEDWHATLPREVASIQ
jgi:hypothetical protein